MKDPQGFESGGGGSFRFLLASRSPRRRELLTQAGFAYAVLPAGAADVDETPQAGEQARDYVLRLARAKAVAGRDAAGMYSRFPVLAADTTVVLDGTIFGKPVDAVEACAMLARLAGRVHEVLTAVAVAQGPRVAATLVVSTVEFRAIGAGEIAAYAATGEPLDKAGAYAIQGRAALFVRRIEGSYSGIMGLPLFETAQLLREFGVEPEAA